MAVGDKFDGAKNGFAFFFAYINAVAQQIGMEQAMAVSTKVDEAMGAAQGKIIKEQSGIEEYDIERATSIASNSIKEGFGIISEVIEESPQRMVLRCGRCPVYEAAQLVGTDTEAIKTFCNKGAMGYMNEMVKQLNPKLTYRMKKFRSTPGDCCEEEVLLG